MITLETARPYLRAHRGALFVVKVGGECLATPERVRRVARELAMIDSLGARLVILHGAGPQTDALLRARGEAPRKIAGRRVTTESALRALQHASYGEVGPSFAAALCAAGVDALPLAAGAAGVLRASRRPPQRIDGERVDFGEVGLVDHVEAEVLHGLLHSEFVPVLSLPASDGLGGFLNVNADLAAAHVAAALGARKLVLATAAEGILSHANDPNSLCSNLTVEQLDALESEGGLQGGMLVKAAAIRLALEGGVERVHVVSGLRDGALIGELYTAHGTGTLITRDPCEEAACAPRPKLVEVAL